MSPAPVFVRIPGSHHPGIRLRLIPGFRDPGSILILGQVTQYGNPYLICITLIAQFCSPQEQTWILFVTHHLSSPTITSQSVQGIDDVYAIFNKYRQLDQFHGHANSSHVSSLTYSHIFIIKYFVRYVYKIYSGGDIWCMCIALLYLDLRLLQC